MLSSDDYIIRGIDNFAVSFEDGLRHDEYTFSGFPRDLANVDRVEIIKGPASILYGQLESGGLVNVVTRKPLEDPRFSVEGRGGSFSNWRFALDATGPLVADETLLYRFNIRLRERPVVPRLHPLGADLLLPDHRRPPNAERRYHRRGEVWHRKLNQ